MLPDWGINWRTAITLMVLTASLVFAYQVHNAFSDAAVLSPQSQTMVERSQAFATVINTGAWPPGYAILLCVARALHIWPRQVNLMLLCCTLLLVLVVSGKYLTAVNAVWPLLLYAVSAFNYYNLSQFTAEALVVPASMLIFLLLIAYLKRQTNFLLLLLSITCTVLFLSRYHAVAWLLPVLAPHIVFSGQKSRSKAGLHLATFSMLALGPVSAFMLRSYLQTGYITAIPRFGYATRGLPKGLSYFAEQTGFGDNIALTVQTLFVDFLSPWQFPTHEVNRTLYDASFWEIGLGILFALTVATIALKLFRHRSSICSRGLVDQFRTRYQDPGPIFLLTEYFVAYILVTILMWTVGNNDPIYSRFMYPSYVYLMLLMFAGYSFVKQSDSSSMSRLPPIALYWSVVLVNLHKIAHSLHLLG